MTNQQGFTLIEIIMAIVLASVLGLFTIQYIQNAAQTNQLVAGQKDLVDQAKTALEFLTRELRLAHENLNDISCSPGGTGGCDDIAYTAITFDKIMEDPADALRKDTNPCRIEYSYNSGSNTLERKTWTTFSTTDCTVSSAVTTTLAQNVSAFSIQENSDGGHWYQISITLTGTDSSYTLSTGVRPRSTI